MTQTWMRCYCNSIENRQCPVHPYGFYRSEPQMLDKATVPKEYSDAFTSGWNSALEQAAIDFGPEATDQAGYNIAKALRSWKK